MLADYHRLMLDWQAQEIPPAAGRHVTPAGAEADIARAYSRSQATLAAELINSIHIQEPQFFEELVIDVLLAMGYGGRRRDLTRRLGRTGDGGVDGLIAMDELGLDQIYLQAKRLKPGSVVPVSEVRDFAGALDANHASKGVFVATSHFSPAAVNFSQQVSRRVVLIDGSKFAELMIRYNIGVRVQRSYQIKRIDPDYFRPGRNAEMISASAQPRR
jgi:restriction system protein